MCGEVPYVGKAKTKFRAEFNNYKTAHRSYRKKHKVSQQHFHEHYGNTVIMGLIIGSSH